MPKYEVGTLVKVTDEAAYLTGFYLRCGKIIGCNKGCLTIQWESNPGHKKTIHQDWVTPAQGLVSEVKRTRK